MLSHETTNNRIYVLQCTDEDGAWYSQYNQYITLITFKNVNNALMTQEMNESKYDYSSTLTSPNKFLRL